MILNTCKKRIIGGIIMLALFQTLFSGCGKKAGEEQELYPYGEMSEDFQFIVQDVFTITKENGETGVVVVGVNENSPLYTGTQVNIVSETGTITATEIGGIEVYQTGIVEAAPAGTNLGVELIGLTADDLSAGDIIVLRQEEK